MCDTFNDGNASVVTDAVAHMNAELVVETIQLLNAAMLNILAK